MCNYCNGDEAIFWKDDANCAFIDSHGEMMVVANDKTIRFKVNRCPMCGRSFDSVNTDANARESLFVGDHIWYVDCDANEEFVEHAIVDHLAYLRGTIEWFSAKFDNGDIDEFGPTALGTYCFKSEEEAIEAWRRAHE